MRSLTNQKLAKSKSYSSYYPWVVITLCAGFIFYRYLLQVSPSVMTDELMSHFKVNGAGLGNLTATFFYAYMIMQFLSGPLLDKYSPRILTTLAIMTCIIGAFLFVQSSTLLEASLSRMLVGAGAAFATASYMKMAATWFPPKRFALVSGLLATAAMAGSMAAQAPMAWLVSAVGWHATLYDCCILGLGFIVLFFILAKDKDTPATPYSEDIQQFHFNDLIKLLKCKSNWLLTLYSGLSFAPITVFGGLWGNPFLMANFHIDKTTAASITSLMFFGLAIGAPILAVVSSRCNDYYKVMMGSIILSLISLTAALYLPMPLWLEGLCLFLFGFGTGAFMLGFVVGKELNPIGLAASIISLINTGNALFGALSEPLVGKLVDLLWDGKTIAGVHQFSVHEFHWAFLILPLYLLIALLCLYKIKNSILSLKEN